MPNPPEREIRDSKGDLWPTERERDIFERGRLEGLEEAVSLVSPPESARVHLTEIEDRAFWAAVAQAENRIYAAIRSLRPQGEQE